MGEGGQEGAGKGGKGKRAKRGKGKEEVPITGGNSLPTNADGVPLELAEQSCNEAEKELSRLTSGPDSQWHGGCRCHGVLDLARP